MRNYYRGEPLKSIYKSADDLELIKIKDHDVIINPENGGWAKVTEKEKLQLFSPTRILGDSIGEKAYLSGLASKNGSYIFESDKVFLSPSVLYFFEFNLSNSCNLDCVYCGNSTCIDTIEEPDLKIGKLWIDRIYDYIKEKKIPKVTLEFTGGEPLVNVDFMSSVCEYAYEKFDEFNIEPNIVLSTNLTVIGSKQIDFLKRYKPSLQVSLDGTKEVHDSQRPYPSGKGSYDDIVKNLQKLRDEGVPATCIASVITSQSVDKMPEIAQNIIDLGYRQMTLQPMQSIGRGNEVSHMMPDPEKYVDKLFETLDKVVYPHWEKIQKKMSVRHAGLAFAYLLEPWRVYMCQRCPCGNADTIISTDAKGDVYGCNQAPFDEETILGNITEDSFIDCQNHEHTKPFRERDIMKIEECSKCTYRSYCQGGCTRSALTVHGTSNAPGDSCELNKVLYKKAIEKLIEEAYPIEFVKSLARSYAKR